MSTVAALEVTKAENHLFIALREANDSQEAERICSAINALEGPLATAKRLAEHLSREPFSTSDGSDDPNRASLIETLNAFVADREATETEVST